MRILDYFWYMHYRFIHYTIKRNDYNSRWAAVAGVAFDLLLYINLCVELYLYFFNYDYYIKYCKSEAFLVIAVLLFVTSAIYFLTIRKNIVIDFEDKYNKLPSDKKKKIWIIFTSIATMPLILFIILVPLLHP